VLVATDSDSLIAPDAVLPYYWHLPVEAAYDMTTGPDDLAVGQISDYLDFQPYTSGEAGSARHDLAGLIRALQFKTQPQVDTVGEHFS